MFHRLAISRQDNETRACRHLDKTQIVAEEHFRNKENLRKTMKKKRIHNGEPLHRNIRRDYIKTKAAYPNGENNRWNPRSVETKILKLSLTQFF
ncbi:hypothetical protein CDAR_261421 [Caerostris darwini]|uniref:Uncharacterized protein n=1 Tax=Caerostris darwini TaxID=1538125 RepID=A0AAV4SV46_9ARAC|nr:hypothetical protein CDAR_261421 [Caerostris darwini]